MEVPYILLLTRLVAEVASKSTESSVGTLRFCHAGDCQTEKKQCIFPSCCGLLKALSLNRNERCWRSLTEALTGG